MPTARMRDRKRVIDVLIQGVPFYPFKIINGSEGLSGYTQRAETQDGKNIFYSFRLKAVGKGARSGRATKYEYIGRLTVKHRKKKDARVRAYRLAGISLPKKPPRPKKENPPGSGYCMKCRKTMQMVDPKNIMANVRGKERPAIRGSCPDCSTPIQKFGKIALCPECKRHSEIAADDYICKRCRQGE